VGGRGRQNNEEGIDSEPAAALPQMIDITGTGIARGPTGLARELFDNPSSDADSVNDIY
jgi:hypothetical protein